MPRPKTDIRYQEKVAILAEQGLRSPTIQKRIQEEAEAELKAFQAKEAEKTTSP